MGHGDAVNGGISEGLECEDFYFSPAPTKYLDGHAVLVGEYVGLRA